MIENDVERTEKKVDLLFKVLLGLKVKHIGYLYNRKYIENYMDDLIPIYDLFVKKDIIENYPTQEEIQKWERKLHNEHIKLKQDYGEGNFLAKEQDTIKLRMRYLENKLDQMSKLSKNKEKFENKNIELYNINLFKDLQTKLGITREYDRYSYRKIIREKDNLKKTIQNLVKELDTFLDKKEEL